MPLYPMDQNASASPSWCTRHPRRPTASQPNMPDGCRSTFQRCCGEREVKKLNLLRSPVFWCLGDGPTMHEPGALPKTPGRRVTALPMTDHLVTRPGADVQPQRPLPQALVLACRRVCWALSGRHRAGGRTRRCVLKITRWELTTWVVFVAVSAVWRLEARGVAVWPQLHVSGWGLPLVG